MHRCKHIPQPLKADPQAKAVVRASTSPTREKLFFKISFPSKNFKNANPQTDTKTFGQLVAKFNNDKGCETRTTRTPGHNITYTQAGVSCFVGQESCKFKVQCFVSTFVVKIRHYAKPQNVCDLNQYQSETLALNADIPMEEVGA
jgi:hypothetical protein